MFFNNLVSVTRGNTPVILGGDFNCVLFETDRSTDSQITTCFAGRRELCTIIHSLSLVDSWLNVNSIDNNGHTWFHSGKGQSSRMDRIYVHEGFRIIKSSKIAFPLSDHDAVHTVITVPHERFVFHSYWKFNVSFCKDEAFIHDLAFQYSRWQTLKPGFESIGDWWENVKGRIKELCIKHGVRRSRDRRLRLKKLQDSCVVADRDTVCQLLQAEEEGAFIRSREKSGWRKTGILSQM